MQFLDNAHHSEFNRLLLRYSRMNDPEYSSAFYVLTCSEEMRMKALPFISSDGIDWESMRKHNDFSTGYRLMIQLANNLFSYSGEINLASMIGTFDAEFYQILLNAIEIRRKGYQGCH